MLAEHRVEVDLAPDLPLLQLDAVLFEQVLFNLLDNAAKYAPAGSTVRLRAWHEAAGQREGVVRLQVIDEGAGLPRGRAGAHLRQVLPRARRRPPARRHRAGAGDLPRLRRGDGRHASPPPTATDRSGAVFTVTLPVRAGRPARRAMTGQTVLVVDDEPAIRRLLRTSLGAQGYRVLEAATGAEALAAHRARTGRTW